MDKQDKIEIEFRSILSKKKYDQLKKFLEQEAEDLGLDDKNVFFFILPDRLLKVTNNISGSTAKITLKLNKIGRGSDFQELEFPIAPRDVDKAVRMFKNLGFNQLQESFQKRHNYKYKGVEIALKWSKVWDYHLELEILINDLKQKQSAEEKIKALAKELDIHLMAEEELRKFVQKADQDYQEGKYDKK